MISYIKYLSLLLVTTASLSAMNSPKVDQLNASGQPKVAVLDKAPRPVVASSRLGTVGIYYREKNGT